MRYILILYASLFIFSCGKDKMVQLPEINHSEISEINDVSAAYLFYNETEVDSIELNRKNLISTTNWLVNVDKRLTLKQAIPKIKFLQEKKQKSEHKNENAKNYFTCNDISKKDLGFIEFTNVVYEKKRIVNIIVDELSNNNKSLVIYIASLNDIKINSFFETTDILNTNIHKLTQDIIFIIKKQKKVTTVILCFNENLSFQEYISIKSNLSQKELKNISISNEEIISN